MPDVEFRHDTVGQEVRAYQKAKGRTDGDGETHLGIVPPLRSTRSRWTGDSCSIAQNQLPRANFIAAPACPLGIVDHRVCPVPGTGSMMRPISVAESWTWVLQTGQVSCPTIPR